MSKIEFHFKGGSADKHQLPVNFMIDLLNNIKDLAYLIIAQNKGIDFDEKKITITYPVNHKALDCFYNEEIENMLFDNRRELVQVIGKVILDENEQPKKITDVISIQDIDLTPIELDDIIYNNKTKLHFKKSIVLTPTLDDTKQLYTINYPEIGLNAFAYTRQEIMDDIKSDIIYLWEEYVKSDDKLSEDAEILKNNLKDIIEEVKYE